MLRRGELARGACRRGTAETASPAGQVMGWRGAAVEEEEARQRNAMVVRREGASGGGRIE